jgi:hypothetical protein
MKKFILVMAGAVVLAACSAPKYTYHFDHYDYNSGKKKTETASLTVNESTSAATPPAATEESFLILENENATVSTDPQLYTTSGAAPTIKEKSNVEKKYSELTKAEKKEFRKALKTEIKKYAKAIRNGDSVNSVAATKVMDNDLKLAIIFGAVALTLSFFGGVNSVFWVLSVVSLVIAVVFFIKWIAEQ